MNQAIAAITANLRRGARENPAMKLAPGGLAAIPRRKARCCR